ncbi:MAG: GDYXXLXY domain-containing protein [Verrucomicrobiia bacterium]
MERRILSDKQARWLRREVAEWRGRGIVTPQQAEQITACYETPEEAGARKRSRFTFTIIGLAALLFGAAALLLMGYNWEAIPRVAKLTVVFTVLAATHGAGLYLRFGRGGRRASELVFFLGCLFFGASIWLVAQAFHLNAHYPDGFWWWAIGVLPFALCLDTLLIHCLYVGLLATWAGTEILGYRHLGLAVVDGWPRGAFSLPLLALPGLAWAYRRASVGALWLYVPLVAWWVILQAFSWNLDWQSVFVIGSVGALLLIVAENHRRGNRLALPYRFYGVLLTAGALVPLSSDWFFREISHSDRYGWYSEWRTLAFAPVIAILVLLAATLVMAGLFKPKPAGSARGPGERLLDVFRAQWLPAGLALAMAFMGLWSAIRLVGGGEGHDWVLPLVVANVAQIALSLWLMRVGIRDDRGLPFAFGVFCFVLWAVCCYCHLFGGAGGMLGAALMFALCGAALLGLGMYWRKRKEVRQGQESAISADPEAASLAGATWLGRAAHWLRDHERAVLWTTIAFQLAVLASMIVLHALPLMVGETIRLKVTPVDPRDMMRGDYVILSYDISNVPAAGIEGIPDANNRLWGYWNRDAWLEERTVYVTLELDANGKFWHGVKASVLKPASGKFIRGKYDPQRGIPHIEFGIEAYYVQEGAGKKLEQARNARSLVAEVALMSSGKAALSDLIVESWKR